MYVADGRFVARPAAPADSVIELNGRFVVPPFAEAHTHWPDAAAIGAYLHLYLHDGVFYVMDQGTSPGRGRASILSSTVQAPSTTSARTRCGPVRKDIPFRSPGASSPLELCRGNGPIPTWTAAS